MLFAVKDDEEGEEGDEDDDDDCSEMELDEDYPDMNASPLVRFERFDREDDLIIEFDNMFSSASKLLFNFFVLNCLLKQIHNVIRLMLSFYSPS